MKNFMKIIIALLVIVALIGGFFATSYNGLVNAKEEIDGQWAIIESKLQRRYDLIPNLVETVKGSMKQEKEVFGRIADARAQMAGAKSVEEKVKASNELEGALSRLLVVMENYPQLRSNENVTRLMDELAGTENRISVERDRYNIVVKEYNKKIKSFPKNIIAGILGFDSIPYFESDKEAKEAPKVSF
ncbi:LemA family protein [Tepidibacter formicigenes]|uniref:LemA protein n=1 Tax=Tepidibacter formicigenes DSM 15518 TaxID=1123349 RepID=A0A1M6LJX3_9FIRM|nr:LemA family protein [Tepidibacter formicigenes]SHJ71504.1 LemA protein [Tepidibacter formicigenes DSM 15518]